MFFIQCKNALFFSYTPRFLVGCLCQWLQQCKQFCIFTTLSFHFVTILLVVLMCKMKKKDLAWKRFIFVVNLLVCVMFLFCCDNCCIISKLSLSIIWHIKLHFHFSIFRWELPESVILWVWYGYNNPRESLQYMFKYMECQIIFGNPVFFFHCTIFPPLHYLTNHTKWECSFKLLVFSGVGSDKIQALSLKLTTQNAPEVFTNWNKFNIIFRC